MLNFPDRRLGEVQTRPLLAGEKVSRKYRRAMIRRAEYLKLKAIVPAVAHRRSVTKLTVIEEAIRYIDELHSALARKMKDLGGSDCHTVDGYDPDAFIRDLIRLPEHRQLQHHPLPHHSHRLPQQQQQHQQKQSSPNAYNHPGSFMQYLSIQGGRAPLSHVQPPHPACLTRLEDAQRYTTDELLSGDLH